MTRPGHLRGILGRGGAVLERKKERGMMLLCEAGEGKRGKAVGLLVGAALSAGIVTHQPSLPAFGWKASQYCKFFVSNERSSTFTASLRGIISYFSKQS